MGNVFFDEAIFKIIIPACFCLLFLIVVIVGGLMLYNSNRKKDVEKGSVDVVESVGEEGEEDGKACPSCGARNPAENNFCEHCGEKL